MGKSYSVAEKTNAVVAVCAGQSVSAVARDTGIDRSTISRWVREFAGTAPTRDTMAGLMFLVFLEGGISLERYRAARMIDVFTRADQETPDVDALDELVGNADQD